MITLATLKLKLPRPIRRFIDVSKEVAQSSLNDEVEERSAALAFHVGLALAPLLFLLLLVGGLFFSEQALIRSVTDVTAGVLDESIAVFVEQLLLSIQELQGVALASLISIAVLLFAAARAIYHFRSAFHFILVGEERARGARTLRSAMQYVSSMVILVIILMLVVLLMLFKSVIAMIVAQEGIVVALSAPLISFFGSSLALVMLWFTLSTVYRLVGKEHTTLQARLTGALFAAVLITLLNEFIAFVLSDVTIIAYGVASSLIGLMLWSYYTVMVILVGAEIAKILSKKKMS